MTTTVKVRDTVNGDGTVIETDVDGYWDILCAASDTLRNENEDRIVSTTREDGITTISRGMVLKLVANDQAQR